MNWSHDSMKLTSTGVEARACNSTCWCAIMRIIQHLQLAESRILHSDSMLAVLA